MPLAYLDTRDLQRRAFRSLMADLREYYAEGFEVLKNCMAMRGCLALGDYGEAAEALAKAVQSLRERDCVVLCLRYGLINGVKKTPQQMAGILGVPIKDVREMEAVALRHLEEKLRGRG